MNKRGLEAMPVLLAIIGAFVSWIMASRMEAGIIMKIVIALLTLVACYFLSAFIGSQG